ncbi:MAG TPA: hypothetical protein DCL15_05745 [Chloroflexi bacterium]|nr:hypothetical protein [Chloroflexota bacterium]
MTVPKRFEVLRFMGALFKVFAWITLILAILSAIAIVLLPQISGLSDVLGPYAGLAVAAGAGAIVTGLLVLLGGLLNFVMLYALGEIILLQIAVEENTRLTAALLLKMHQDTLPEPTASAAAYSPPGGFANEPAPYR